MKRTLLILILILVAAISVARNKLVARSEPNSARSIASQPTPVQKSKPREQSSEPNRRPVAAIDTPDEYDRTPLMLVAARNDTPAARRLLAQGADVNAKSKDDYTALMYASFYGNREMVEFLTDKGADVNARHKTGLTALIEAAKQNLDAGDVITDYVGTVEVLLKKGADVSVTDKNDLTALMYAEKYGLRNKK